jgi:hypothetical protein
MNTFHPKKSGSAEKIREGRAIYGPESQEGGAQILKTGS